MQINETTGATNSQELYQPIYEEGESDLYAQGASTSQERSYYASPTVKGRKKDSKYCECCGPCACKTWWGLTFWILFIIAIIVGTAILIIYYVVMPKMIQSALNSVQLEFVQVTMSNPTTNSVDLSAQADISNVDTYGLSASIEPSNMVMLMNGMQMGLFTSSPVTLSGSSPIFSIVTTLYITDPDLFTTFATDMIQGGGATMEMQGVIDVTVHILGSDWAVNGLTLDKFLTVAGLTGLPPIEVLNMDVQVTPENTVVASITGSLFNPTIISIVPLGNLSYVISYNNSDMGYLEGQSVSLYTGMNVVTLQGVIQPTDVNTMDAMISRFLLGEPFTLIAHPRPGVPVTSVPLYEPALQNLNLTATVDLPRVDLGYQVSMHVEPFVSFCDWLKTKKAIVPTAVKFHNPFSADIYITGIDLYVVYNKTECGYSHTSIDANNTKLNILVPGNSTSWSVPVPVVMDLSGGGWKTHELAEAIFTELVNGYVLLGLYGNVNITVGNLKLYPYYEQPEIIPTCFYGPQWNLSRKCDEYEQKHDSSLSTLTPLQNPHHSRSQLQPQRQPPRPTAKQHTVALPKCD